MPWRHALSRIGLLFVSLVACSASANGEAAPAGPDTTPDALAEEDLGTSDSSPVDVEDEPIAVGFDPNDYDTGDLDITAVVVGTSGGVELFKSTPRFSCISGLAGGAMIETQFQPADEVRLATLAIDCRLVAGDGWCLRGTYTIAGSAAGEFDWACASIDESITLDGHATDVEVSTRFDLTSVSSRN